MDAGLSFAEGIRFVSEEPVARPRGPARWRAVRYVIVTVVGSVAALLLSVIIVAQVAESRLKQCTANLRRLGLAFHEFHEAHGNFPAPALAGSEGKPLLSWRVAILPHLGYRPLYERFHLDEPWDSPHNRSLLAEMPPELTCPGGDGRRDGQTGYRVVVGPLIDSYSVNTPFDATRGVDLREITDGTSNTVLVVETDALVPWTKPDELVWTPGGPLPQLRSPHANGTHALFADGATRFLKRTIERRILLALFTINGGEVFGGG
jgi:Protein of unknown function (DUF1559)